MQKSFTLLTRLSAAFWLALSLFAATNAHSQTFTTLHSLSSGEGTSLYGQLVQGSDGNFYGTAQQGGAHGFGSVFKVTPTGDFQVLYSFGSTAGDDGYPIGGLVQGNDGNFYGTTTGTAFPGGGTIFKITPAGQLTTLYTVASNGSDGRSPQAPLVQGTDGNFYGTTISGGANLTGTIFKVATNGTAAGTTFTVLHTFTATSGGVNSDGAQANGLMQASDGNFYGTTFSGGTAAKGVVFKITTAGSFLVLHQFTAQTAGESRAKLVQAGDGVFYGTSSSGLGQGAVFKVVTDGSAAGTAVTIVYDFSTASDNSDGGGLGAPLVIDESGNLYGMTNLGGTVSSDSSNSGTIFRLTPAGSLQTLYSFGAQSGQGQPHAGVVFGSDGNLYGTTKSTVFKFGAPLSSVYQPYTISTLAGGDPNGGTADGTGAAAKFNLPKGLAFDAAGNAYVADTGNHTIRKVTPTGATSTFAGTPGASGATDSSGGAPLFKGPRAVAVDGAGNLYIADTSNHTIRKITSGGTVTTFAGLAGAIGSTNGTGSAARFNNPSGVAVDKNGIVYVADFGNSTIRKITPAGVVSTLAGQPNTSGSTDGTGSAALFSFPTGIAVDGAGNLLVGDTSNHTIRKITPAGVVTTLAGLAGSFGTTDGSGNNARFNQPRGVAVDADGNVFVADSTNHTIRRVNSAGAVTTLAGLPGAMGFTDGTGAAARLANPYGVAVQLSGKIAIADSSNCAIRAGLPAGGLTFRVNGSKEPSSITSGDPITFTATIPQNDAGYFVRVQASTQPNVEDSWSDIGGGGGIMTSNGDGTYTLTTTGYPSGNAIYFRAIATSASPDVISNVVGPFSLTIDPGVDLLLSLTASTEINPQNGVNVLPGEIITYTLTVYNGGTNAAQNVVVIDRVPNHTKFVSASDGGFVNEDGFVQFNLGTLPATGPAEAKKLKFLVRVDKNTAIGTLITNGNSGVLADGVPTANGRDKPETFVKSPVEVELSSDTNTVARGGVITYTFIVRNLQPQLAKNVRVSVPLPDGTQFVSANPGGTLNGGTVFFALGDLPPDATRKFQLTVQLPYDAGAQKAVVLGGVEVSTGSGGTKVIFHVDDVVSKVSVDKAPTPQLSLTKFLPDGLTIEQYFLASAIGGGSDILDSFNKVFPTLRASQDLDTLGQIVNPSLSNATDDKGNAYLCAFAPGLPEGPEWTSLNVALVYNNSGQAAADNVVIQDRVAEGTRFVQGTAKRDGVKIDSNTVAVQDNGRTLRFSLGRVPPGAHLITYRVAVLPRSAGGEQVGSLLRFRGSVLRTSSLSSDVPIAPEEVDVKLIKPANAFLESYASVTNPEVGDTISYDTFYQNTGGVPSTDLQIVDPIPDGTSFVGAGLLNHNRKVRPIDPDRGEQPPDAPAPGSTTGAVRFHLGKVAPGEFGFVRLTVRVLQSARQQEGLVISHEPAIMPASFAQSPNAPDATAKGATPQATGAGSLLQRPSALSLARLTNPDLPVMGLLVTAPMAVQEGEIFEYLIACMNSSDNFLDSSSLQVTIPDGAKFVSAEAVDQPWVPIRLTQQDNQGNPTVVAFFDSGEGFKVRVPPHAALLRKIKFRATNGTAGKTLLSQARTSGGTGSSKLAPCHAGPVSTYVYGANEQFEDVRAQIVASGLATEGVDAALPADDPKFREDVKALLSNAASTRIGGLDYLTLKSGAALIPLGDGKVAVAGVATAVNANKLIGNDGGGLVAQGGGNLVAQGAGNLIDVAKVISKDGGSFNGGPASNLLGLVAQGGGNLIAQGAGNLVASGAGNLVLNRPGEVSRLVNNNSGQLVPLAPGLSLVASGAGNLVASGAGNLVASGAGNLVASGAGNLVASGAGNFLAGNGGALVSPGANLAVKSSDVSRVAVLTEAGLISQGGGNLVASGAGNLVAQGGGN